MHLPKITYQILPTTVVPFGKPYQARVTILDSATGKPYGTRISNVQITWDNLCVESDGDRYTTNTAGVVVRSYTAQQAEGVNCVRLRGPAFDILGLGWIVARPGIVGATPSKTSAKVGTIVPVNGTVRGSPHNCKLELQRLRGASQWRGVSQTKVLQNGRYTVLAQPPAVGNNVYRVSFPACYQFRAGVSKSFVIRGT